MDMLRQAYRVPPRLQAWIETILKYSSVAHAAAGFAARDNQKWQPHLKPLVTL
jgi:hypothetical protein